MTLLVYSRNVFLYLFGLGGFNGWEHTHIYTHSHTNLSQGVELGGDRLDVPGLQKSILLIEIERVEDHLEKHFVKRAPFDDHVKNTL